MDMGLSNKAATRMSYTMGVVGCVLTVVRILRYIDGIDDIWQPVSIAVITAGLFAIGYRRSRAAKEQD